MTNITRFDPFNDLVRFEPLWDFNDLLNVPAMRGMWRNLPAVPPIKVDLSEDDKVYHVKAEIPGLRKEDIKVSIDGNQVSISTNMNKETEERNGERLIRSERYCGSQFRSFTLEQNIDEGKTQAKYENGVLELTLPKKAMPTARHVVVN